MLGVDDEVDREFVEWSRQFMDASELFETPEDAALAQWARTPSAHARVVEVRPAAEDEAVWVVVQLDAPPGHHDQDIVTCVRSPEGKWRSSGSTGASSDR